MSLLDVDGMDRLRDLTDQVIHEGCGDRGRVAAPLTVDAVPDAEPRLKRAHYDPGPHGCQGGQVVDDRDAPAERRERDGGTGEIRLDVRMDADVAHAGQLLDLRRQRVGRKQRDQGNVVEVL